MEDIWSKSAENATPHFSIRPDAMVYEAIELMVKNHLGGVFISEGTQLLGIFTERDYLKKVVLKGRNSKSLPIKFLSLDIDHNISREVMTTNIIRMGTIEPIEKCIRLMDEHHIRHMLVMNMLGGDISYSEKCDSDVGVITMLEIIRYLSKITRELGSDSFYRS
jgi:predicted transcriptional regulator